MRLFANGGVDLAQCLLDPEPDSNPLDAGSPSWCIFNKCRTMPDPVEEMF